MRFFVVRLAFFTILFFVILWLLTWIAPRRTAHTIDNLTDRLPISNTNTNAADDLIITDLSPSPSPEADSVESIYNEDTDDNIVTEKVTTSQEANNNDEPSSVGTNTSVSSEVNVNPYFQFTQPEVDEPRDVDPIPNNDSATEQRLEQIEDTSLLRELENSTY